MKTITILVSPTGEEFFEAYGPMSKDRSEATQFVNAEVAAKAADNRFGRSGNAFWESERRAEKEAFAKYAGWTHRTEPAT